MSIWGKIWNSLWVKPLNIVLNFARKETWIILRLLKKCLKDQQAKTNDALIIKKLYNFQLNKKLPFAENWVVVVSVLVGDALI